MSALVSLMTLSLWLSGCGDDAGPLKLTDQDSTSEVLLDTGEQVEIRLESNPGTGYQWRLDPMVELETLTLVTADFEPPDTELAGSPGVEVFVFEAVTAGAEVLRLEYIRPFDDPIIPDRVAEFIIRVDGVPLTAPDQDPPTTSTATAPTNGDDQDADTDQDPDTDPDPDTDTDQAGGRPAIPVDQLFDGEGPREATVTGFVIWDRSGARLCQLLLESMPPQCGGLAVVIANPLSLEDQVDEASGVRWTNTAIDVTGRFDGQRLVLAADAETVIPTAADNKLIEAFLSFADAPGPETAAALPLADDVAIGLGQTIITTVPAGELADPAQWVLDVEEYQGFAGPFSALDLAGQPVTTTIGSHPRCAGPPVAPPVGFDNVRRISIEPSSATSCIEWWTIDFFVDDGSVIAITIDLFGP